MKITMVRASSLPVLEADFKQFQADFRVLYDKIKARFPGVLTEEESRRFQWLAERCQERLFKKYPLKQIISLPKTGKAWKALMSEYGPFVIAQARETHEIVLVIQDRG